MDQNWMMGGTPPTDNQQSANNVPQPNEQDAGMSTPLPSELVGAASQNTIATPVPADAQFATAGTSPMAPAQSIAMNAQYKNAGVPVAKKSNATLVETIILIVVCLIAAGAVIYAVSLFTKYHNLQNSYNADKEAAVAEAVRARGDADEAAFLEREKEPFNEWTGPSDFGTLSFKYPKTWSVYLRNDSSDGGDYKVYFAPSWVNNIDDSNSRYALRFYIYNMQYNSYIANLERKVEEGTLRASSFSEQDGQLIGMRYEGELDSGIVGILLAIKINDKTAVLRTDSENYRTDFDELVDSLRRNS